MIYPALTLSMKRAVSSGALRKNNPLGVDKNGMVKPFEKKILALQAFQNPPTEDEPSSNERTSTLPKISDNPPELTAPNDVFDRGFFLRMQEELTHTIQTSELELKRFITEQLDLVASETKRDVGVDNKKEISLLRADLVQTAGGQVSAMYDELRSEMQKDALAIRSEMQNNTLAITAEVQKISAQKENLTPLMQRIDELQLNVDTSSLLVHIDQLGAKLDSGLLPAAVAAGAAASTAVLTKMDEVQAKVLEAIDSKKLKSLEQDSDAVGTTVPGMISLSSDDLSAWFEQTKLQFDILNETLKPDSFCKPVLERIVALGSLMEANQENVNIIANLNAKHESLLGQVVTQLSSMLEALENANVGEEKFLPVLNRIDSLDTKLTSVVQVLENTKLREEDSLPAMSRNEGLDLSVGFAPVLQEIHDLRVYLDKSKMQDEERIAAVNSKIEKTFDPVLQRIVALDSQVQTNQGHIVAHLNTMHDGLLLKTDTSFLSPILSKIETMRTAIVEKVQMREEREEDLLPVISLIDQTIAQVKVNHQIMWSAVKEVSDQIKSQVSPDSIRKSMDSLDMHLRQSISQLRTDQSWLSPVLRQVDAQCGTIRALMEKELLVIRENMQKSKGSEEDLGELGPILKKLDMLLDPAFRRHCFLTRNDWAIEDYSPHLSRRESAPSLSQSHHIAAVAQQDRADVAAGAVAAAAPAAGAAKAAVQQQQFQKKLHEQQEEQQEEPQCSSKRSSVKVQLKLEELARVQKHSCLNFEESYQQQQIDRLF